MNIDWHIGDVITKLRKQRRMNQTVLAKKVGVSKATIVRAEDGDPKVSRQTYVNIARVLGTKLASLEVEAARLESGSSSRPERYQLDEEPRGAAEKKGR
jgi:DNA-binding XRE family transcriptional regulator